MTSSHMDQSDSGTRSRDGRSRNLVNKFVSKPLGEKTVFYQSFSPTERRKFIRKEKERWARVSFDTNPEHFTWCAER